MSYSLREPIRLTGTAALAALFLAFGLAAAAGAAETLIRPDKPTAIAFPAEKAKFVRLVIRATSGGAACIDELEVYGEKDKANLALAERGAKATASSCMPSNPKHLIEHLNDGLYGNENSWIPAGGAEDWAQIELAEPAKVAQVVFSRDRKRQYADRVPISVEVRLSADGKQWKTVKELSGKAAEVVVRRWNSSGFAGAVPGAPPPPKLSRGQVVTPADAEPITIPKQDELEFANLALGPKAKAAASSAMTGYPIHKIAHLNDGLAGNEHSWISQSDPSWAEIDLGDVYWVYKVALGSDSSRQYADRGLTQFTILAADKYDKDSKAPSWQPVYKNSTAAPVHVRTEFKFKPVRARWVRIAVDATSGGEARIDELEVYGQKDAIPLERIGPLPQPGLVESKSESTSTLASKSSKFGSSPVRQ